MRAALSCTAVLGLLATACTDHQTPEIAAGMEAAFGRAPTMEEIEAYEVGAGAAIERELRLRLGTLLQGSRDSAMVTGIVDDWSKTISYPTDPAVDRVLKRLYVNRILDHDSRQLSESRAHARKAGIWVTLGVDDQTAGDARALVVRFAGTSGRSLVILHSNPTPDDIALAFRAIFEDRVRVGDYLDRDRAITVRGRGTAPGGAALRYTEHIKSLQASSARSVGNFRLERAVDVRLGHLRHGLPRTSR